MFPYLRPRASCRTLAKLIVVATGAVSVSLSLAAGRWLRKPRHTRRRGSQEHALLFVADHVNGLALSKRFDFENIEFRRAPVLFDEAMPVFEKPDPCEKKADDQDQCSAYAQQRRTPILALRDGNLRRKRGRQIRPHEAAPINSVILMP